MGFFFFFFFFFFQVIQNFKKALQELIKNKLTTVQRVELSEEGSNVGYALKGVLKADIENIRSTLEKN